MTQIENLPPKGADILPFRKPETPVESDVKGAILDERKLEKLALASPESLKILEKIKQHPIWQKVLKYWGSVAEKDKALLYEDGKPDWKKALKPTGIMAGPAAIPEMIKNKIRYKGRVVGTFSGSMAGAVRAFVQLDMLPAPKNLTLEQIQNDIVEDQRTTENMLKMVKVIITFFAPEALPEYIELEKTLKVANKAKTAAAMQQQKAKIAKAGKVEKNAA